MILFLALGSCLDTELVLEVVIERRLLTDFCFSRSILIFEAELDFTPMRSRTEDSRGGEILLRSSRWIWSILDLGALKVTVMLFSNLPAKSRFLISYSSKIGSSGSKIVRTLLPSAKVWTFMYLKYLPSFLSSPCFARIRFWNSEKSSEFRDFLSSVVSSVSSVRFRVPALDAGAKREKIPDFLSAGSTIGKVNY